jgi:hypothetical protein
MGVICGSLLIGYVEVALAGASSTKDLHDMLVTTMFYGMFFFIFLNYSIFLLIFYILQVCFKLGVSSYLFWD